MAPSRWTATADETLRRLWAKGAALRSIADELGHDDARAVQLRAVHLGLAPRAAEWTKERIADLKRLVHEGVSFSGIAEALGVTRNAAIGKAHRLGLSAGSTEGDAQAAKAQRMRQAAETKRQARAAKLSSGITATDKRRHGPARGTKRALLTAPGFATLSQGAPTPPRLDIIAAVDAPMVAPAAAAEPSASVHFFERRDGQCAWPLWKSGAPRADLFCCGAAIAIGGAQPYCAEHLARSRQPAPRIDRPAMRGKAA